MKSKLCLLESPNPILADATKSLAFCLALLLLPTASSQAQLQVYAEAAEIDGVTNELVSAVLSEAGYEAEISVVPWTRLMHLLESEPNSLAFSMTRTPDREDRFHWIGLIRPITFKLWGLRERADELPRTLEGARDLRISALRGDVVADYLTSIGFTNLVYLSQASNTLTMLLRDRVDLMVYIETGIEDYLSERNASLDMLIPVATIDEISTGHYLVMNKDSDPALVELIEAAFNAVTSNRN